MSGLWNPELWSGISGPTFAILAAVYFTLALARGWIVIGKQYDAEVKRGAAKDETINTLTSALVEKNATEGLVTQILTAVRSESAARNGDQ